MTYPPDIKNRNLLTPKQTAVAGLFIDMTNWNVTLDLLQKGFYRVKVR